VTNLLSIDRRNPKRISVLPPLTSPPKTLANVPRGKMGIPGKKVNVGRKKGKFVRKRSVSAKKSRGRRKRGVGKGFGKRRAPRSLSSRALPALPTTMEVEPEIVRDDSPPPLPDLPDYGSISLGNGGMVREPGRSSLPENYGFIPQSAPMREMPQYGVIPSSIEPEMVQRGEASRKGRNKTLRTKSKSKSSSPRNRQLSSSNRPKQQPMRPHQFLSLRDLSGRNRLLSSQKSPRGSGMGRGAKPLPKPVPPPKKRKESTDPNTPSMLPSLSKKQIVVNEDSFRGKNTLLEGVDRIVMRNQEIIEIPDQVLKMRDLLSLDFSSNKLRALSDVLARMKELRELDVSYNCIEVISPEIRCLSKLRKLLMAHNRVSDIPREVAQSWEDLVELDLSFNRISTPAHLPLLLNLTTLTLRYIYSHLYFSHTYNKWKQNNGFTKRTVPLSHTINLPRYLRKQNSTNPR